MPLSAAASAREILTGLHEIMAGRGAAQSKLDKVVDLIAETMESEVCSIYLLRDNKLELFATHGLRKEAVHVTRLGMGEGLVGTIATVCSASISTSSYRRGSACWTARTPIGLSERTIGTPAELWKRSSPVSSR